MGNREKVLWVVNYDSLDAFAKRAVAAKATAVAIRTDNDLAKAIPVFKTLGIKVYGWRWPRSDRTGAIAEANRVVALLKAGLDGYYVDPEGDPGKPWDWDQDGLAQLAEDFCKLITSAAPGKPFGTTSHYRGKKVFPKLPWAAFFKYSTVLLPQAYWRTAGGVINHGLPPENYNASLDWWMQSGGPQAAIVPMAGELEFATPAEIGEYAATAKSNGINQLHFYTDGTAVAGTVWAAIAAA